jgi:hypothetical protein
MLVRFSTRFGRFGRFSIGFSTGGVSIGVSGMTLGVKLELTFEFNVLLNPELLDSDRVDSISKRYSNRRRATRNIAFV